MAGDLNINLGLLLLAINNFLDDDEVVNELLIQLVAENTNFKTNTICVEFFAENTGPLYSWSGKSTSAGNAVQAQQGQGMAALLVMMAVLFFIVGYCCWGAPCCRAFCRRRCCCCHSMAGDLEASPSDIGLSVDRGMVATPTIILLPYGRMLVVDGSVFAQLQADTNGLDLIELGENVVRAQQRAIPPPTPSVTTGSIPSILEVDSETNSKGCISPVQESFPPPTYDSIFSGENVADLPPSYSEILRQLQSFGSAENENDTIEPTDTGPPAIEDYQPGEIRESRV